MDAFFITYIVVWVAACLVAFAMLVKNAKSYVICQNAYWRWLGQPWKLSTFAIATAGMTLIAPYTGDPTWDYVDAFFMSALTFATAPWVIGTLYQIVRRQRSVRQAFVVLCAWMFSASWSYDIYLVWRDGFYPVTWFANIFASSVLYWAAGLLWSLEWVPNRGVIFGFMQTSWPSQPAAPQFGKLIWLAAPFMLIAIASVLYFVVPTMQ